MKIAVTYENGNVFPHFGRTENFKVYEVKDGKVISSEIVNAGGTGHEALAYLLKDQGIEVLLCGGLGAGAQAALADAGIEVLSGAEGSADDCVEKYLKGELQSQGVNCDHHDHEEAEEGCEGHCNGGCGSCGGGCGGCGSQKPLFEGKNVGKRVKTHYRGTFNDGTPFDSSYDRGEPLEFICGAGMMIFGYDKAVADMNVGESIDIHLMPEDAYGPIQPEAIFTVKIEEMPGAENLTVGQQVSLSDGRQYFPVKVTAKDDESITFDANHEMAGKELNFHIELVSVE